jgi:hypothetical protein
LLLLASILGMPVVFSQAKQEKFCASLSLESLNAPGKEIKGGVLYQGDQVKCLLNFNEASWDGSTQFYCYVIYYSESEADVNLFYPFGDDGYIPELFPMKSAEGKFIFSTTLFEAIITEPYGKDNFVLIMSDSLIDFRPLVNKAAARAGGKNNKEELLKLIKGSKLSSYYQPGHGELSIQSLQIETRPANEKNGLVKKAVNTRQVFAINDSAEIFYTPVPQLDIVRDSFPTLVILDPSFDTSIMRGNKVLPSSHVKKTLFRGIAVDWKRGIQQITVNNKLVSSYQEESGYFDYLLELKEGSNQADITVENKKGYKRTIRLKFQYTAQKETITRAGKDFLFVIGINKYTNWPHLNNATTDAQDFSSLMTNEFGFAKENVIELLDENATRKNIYSQFKRLLDSLTENDRLLIYFSGHGYYDASLDLGYWIPIDAENDASDRYLNNLEITRMVQKMKAKNIFVIADACYSGQLLRDMHKETGGTYKSRMVLCSGKLQPVADGVPGSNSPFAKQVLLFLRQTAGPSLLASDMIQQVKRSFPATATQKPVGGAIDEVGDENGDFEFLRKKKN